MSSQAPESLWLPLSPCSLVHRLLSVLIDAIFIFVRFVFIFKFLSIIGGGLCKQQHDSTRLEVRTTYRVGPLLPPLCECLGLSPGLQALSIKCVT